MDRTIIVRFAGGLGNQMFQYAAAKALAKRLDASLKLDLGWYEDPDPGKARRAFCLGRLNVREPLATPLEVKRYRGYTLYGRAVRKLFGRDVRVRVRRVETARAYWDVESLRRLKGIFLHGYWQNEAYFADAAEEIRAAFPPRADGSEAALRKDIEGTNSLALHVRRGDYAADPKLRSRFGTCSISYYEGCLAEARRRLGPLKVFLFSDDLAWAREKLRLPPGSVAVSPPQDTDGLAGFDVMRRCRHFIISNSSFSWWAAWLGETAGSLVFAPSPWFMSGEDDGGIVPARWIRADARGKENG
jgi:SAM-dependent methyltransferase